MTNKSIYDRYSPASAPKTGYLSADQPAWYFVFRSEEVLVRTNGAGIELPVKSTLAELKLTPQANFYLGKLDDCDCFCIVAADTDDAPEGMVFQKLFSLLGRLDEEIFTLAGRGYHILNWDKKNRYCGRCGTETEMKGDELAKVCLKCGNVIYPKISPAVIVAITNGSKILLAQAERFRGKMFSLIAGFVEAGETFEDCVKREVFEEVGIKVKNIKYFGSQPWPFPDSLMVGFTAEYESGELTIDGKEIVCADWFSRESLPNVPNTGSIAGKIISWLVDGCSEKK